MPRVETVTIETEAGPVRINKSVYDASPDAFTLHGDAEQPALRDDGPTIAEFIAAGYPASNYPPKGYVSKSTDDEIAAAIADEAAKTKQPEPAPVTPAPEQPEQPEQPGAPSLMVMKDGKKHFVVDASGERVEVEGIEKDGYAKEQDAWNAILALPR